jgi:hypothetical protein
MHLSRYSPTCHFPFIWSNNLIPPSFIMDYTQPRILDSFVPSFNLSKVPEWALMFTYIIKIRTPNCIEKGPKKIKLVNNRHICKQGQQIHMDQKRCMTTSQEV